MVPNEFRACAVNCVYGAPLEFVDVAGDDFGPALYIGNEDRDLVLVEELAKALEGTVPDFEVPVGGILTAQLPDHAVEVKDEEVLVLKPSSSLEQKPPCDEC